MSTIDNSSLLGRGSHELDEFLRYVRRARPESGDAACRRYRCLDADDRLHSFARHVASAVAARSPVFRELFRFAAGTESAYSASPALSHDAFFLDDLTYDCGDAVDREIRTRLSEDPRYRLLAPKGLRVLRAWHELVTRDVRRVRSAIKDGLPRQAAVRS